MSAESTQNFSSVMAKNMKIKHENIQGLTTFCRSESGGISSFNIQNFSV